MKNAIFTFICLFQPGIIFCSQYETIREDFHIPRFYHEKILLHVKTTRATEFATSLNTGYTWGGYSPGGTSEWGVIGYLYQSTLDHIRNAMCFNAASESPGSYVYCLFDSPEFTGTCDSLNGLSFVIIEFQVDNPQDSIGLMVRDAKGNWYYSAPEHAVSAKGNQIIVDTRNYHWIKIIFMILPPVVHLCLALKLRILDNS